MGLIDMCFFNEYEKSLIYVSFLNSVTLSTNSSNYIVFIPLHTRELWVSEPYHSPGLGVRIDLNIPKVGEAYTMTLQITFYSL